MRLMLQLARLTDGYHSLESGLTPVEQWRSGGEEDTLRCSGKHSRLLKWAFESGSWHPNHDNRDQPR